MKKITYAWRNIRKNRGFSLLNIFGMTLGITCFLLLGAYVIHERSYDRFHPQVDRIAYVSFAYKAASDAEYSYSPTSPTAVAPTLAQNFSEVEKAVRLYHYNKEGLIPNQGQAIREKGLKYADSDFFDVIAYPFLAGDASTALAAPQQIVLTQALADKYFPGTMPIGQTLDIDGQPWKITGVIENPPSYTQLPFTAILSNTNLSRYKEPVWHSANDITLLLLKSKDDFAPLEAKANTYLQKTFADTFSEGFQFKIQIEKLADLHLYSKAGTGNLRYLYIFSALALGIIIIACVNFTNLSLARANERSKEISVRKVLGASRPSIFYDFLLECSLMVSVAVSIALLLSYFLLPFFAQYIGSSLTLALQANSASYLSTLLFAMVIAVLAGSWPAFVISAFKPIATHKKSSKGSTKGFSFGNILLVLQFTLSTLFIICTLATMRQLHYIQSVDTGLQRAQIVVLDGDLLSDSDRTTLKNKLTSLPQISGMTASYDSPVNIRGGYNIQGAEGKAADFGLNVTAIPVEKDFVQVFEIPMLAGAMLTDFDIARARDTSAAQEYSFMVNAQFIAAMQWSATEAIGKQINLNGRQGRITSVLQDFNFTSLKQEITPVVLFPEYSYFGNIFVKLAAGSNTQASLAAIAQAWKAVKPQAPFTYHFLDEDYAQMYKHEQQTSRTMGLFSFITIGIACMGLFSLAAFQAQQRVKEIGIRKVLGASVGKITLLLSAQFLQMALIAFIIASPIGWWLMQDWLQEFAYRTALHWSIFVLAGALTLSITLLTISGQAIRAARANPIDSLRDE